MASIVRGKLGHGRNPTGQPVKVASTSSCPSFQVKVRFVAAEPDEIVHNQVRVSLHLEQLVPYVQTLASISHFKHACLDWCRGYMSCRMMCSRTRVVACLYTGVAALSHYRTWEGTCACAHRLSHLARAEQLPTTGNIYAANTSVM